MFRRETLKPTVLFHMANVPVPSHPPVEVGLNRLSLLPRGGNRHRQRITTGRMERALANPGLCPGRLLIRSQNFNWIKMRVSVDAPRQLADPRLQTNRAALSGLFSYCTPSVLCKKSFGARSYHVRNKAPNSTRGCEFQTWKPLRPPWRRLEGESFSARSGCSG